MSAKPRRLQLFRGQRAVPVQLRLSESAVFSAKSWVSLHTGNVMPCMTTEKKVETTGENPPAPAPITDPVPAPPNSACSESPGPAPAFACMVCPWSLRPTKSIEQSRIAYSTAGPTRVCAGTSRFVLCRIRRQVKLPSNLPEVAFCER